MGSCSATLDTDEPDCNINKQSYPYSCYEVGANIDIRSYKDGKWYKAEIKRYKTSNQSSLEWIFELNSSQKEEISKLQKMEGIYVHYTMFNNREKQCYEWIFFRDNDIICDCKRQCIYIECKYSHKHRISLNNHHYNNNNRHEILHEIKDRIGTAITAKNKYGKWYSAIIKNHKSMNALPNDVYFGDLQHLPAVYVDYIGMKKKYNEWISINDNTICNCSKECKVTSHRLSLNHLQSIIQSKIDIDNKDNKYIETILNLKVQRNGSYKWYIIKIKQYKSNYQLLTQNDILNLKDSQIKHIRQLQHKKGIYVHCIGYAKEYDEWIFFNQFNDLKCNCDIYQQCTINQHRIRLFFNGIVGDKHDIKCDDNVWRRMEIKYHKLAHQSVPSHLKFKDEKWGKYEAVHVLWNQRGHNLHNDGFWFMFSTLNGICDCHRQCNDKQHRITSKWNKNLQTEIQLEIRNNNKKYVGLIVDVKNKSDEWCKVKISKFKSKREWFPINGSQIGNFDTLQNQIGVYVKYIDREQLNEWIFYENDIEDIICECLEQCKVSNHAMSQKNNHRQSNIRKYHNIINGFIRQNQDKFIPSDIIKIIVTIYKTLQFYNGSVGDTFDVCYQNGKWRKVQLKYHKLSFKKLPKNIELTKSQQQEREKLEELEGIYIQYNETKNNAWIPLREYAVFCDCKNQCIFTCIETSKHIITSKWNKNLQTEIQSEIENNNERFIGYKIDVKNKFGEWCKVRILRFKSRREWGSIDANINDLELKNIDKLQDQIGIYVNYMHRKQAKNEWRFFMDNMQDITCKCTEECTTATHQITEINNHTQSSMTTINKIIFGFLRQNGNIYIPMDILQIIIDNYKSIKFYNCNVGDSCDIYVDGKWKMGIIINHKPINQSLPFDSVLSNNQQKEKEKLEKLEAVCVRIPITDKSLDKWIFFKDYNEICYCNERCDFHHHQITAIRNHSQSLHQTNCYYDKNCVGKIIRAKDKFGGWFNAIIKHHKSRNEPLPNDNNIYDSQKKEINKLEKLEAIYVHFIGYGERYDEWIFIKDNTICKCNGTCNIESHRLG